MADKKQTVMLRGYDDEIEIMEKEMQGDKKKSLAPEEKRLGAKAEIPYFRKWDKGDSYVLEADLPGFNKSDLKVSVVKGNLIISASKDESGDEVYGSFSQNFDLKEIKADSIEAEFNHGSLSLRLPKKEEFINSVRDIQIR